MIGLTTFARKSTIWKGRDCLTSIIEFNNFVLPIQLLCGWYLPIPQVSFLLITEQLHKMSSKPCSVVWGKTLCIFWQQMLVSPTWTSSFVEMKASSKKRPPLVLLISSFSISTSLTGSLSFFFSRSSTSTNKELHICLPWLKFHDGWSLCPQFADCPKLKNKVWKKTEQANLVCV